MNKVLLKEAHEQGILHIADKPYILRPNGDLIQLSLDLRYGYEHSKGWAHRIVRDDSDVITLARRWAKAQVSC